MDYFYLYIFILVCFIFGVSYLNTYLNSYRETANSDKNDEKNENLSKETIDNDKLETNDKSVTIDT
jgi:hypothetical protein